MAKVVKPIWTTFVLSGFNANNLAQMVTAYKNDCKLCPLIHLILTNANPARKVANSQTRGPDDYVPLALSNDPLAVIQIDETGPLYLGKDGHYVKV